MLTRAIRTPTRSTSIYKPTLQFRHNVSQKLLSPILRRTLYTPGRLKGLYEPLSPQARVVSPVHGAAKYSSGALQRMYTSESDAPAVLLVKELFYKQETQFKPTANKSKPAYSLDASILGLILGALETNKFNDQKVKQFIIDQWRAEHTGITSGARLSIEKINNILTLIEKTYQEDKNEGRSILLAYLYTKADPTSDHDMIHYLSSLSLYMPIFKSAQEKLKHIAIQEEHATLLSKIKANINSIKDYFLGKKEVYTPKEYAAIRETLLSPEVTEKSKINLALEENFEQTVAAILMEKQLSSAFPPEVMQGWVQYKKHLFFPDCVETAIRDFLNCLLYDQKTQSFDLSLLPKSLVLDNDFKQFYTKYNTVDTVNTQKTRQAFLYLIAAIPGVSYAHSDYNLKPGDILQNLPIIMNKFLGTNIQNVSELGKVLSDEHRTIQCTLEKVDDTTNNIIISIHTPHLTQEMQLYFTPGHGRIEIPARDLHQTKEYFLNPVELANKYALSQEAQTLFSIQSNVYAVSKISDKQPPSAFYSLRAKTDSDKFDIINEIARFPHNKDLTDYAYTLYKSMSPAIQINTVNMVYRIAPFNPKFNNAYTIIKPENEVQTISLVQDILKYASNNSEAVEYAYTLFNSLPVGIKVSNILGSILKSGVWETNKNFENFCLEYLKYTISVAEIIGFLTPDFVKKLHAKLPVDQQKNLLLFVLGTLGNKADLISITNTLIHLGSDIHAQEEKTHVTPLLYAIKKGNVPIIETLIQHGASVNQVHEVNTNFAGWNFDLTLPKQQTPIDTAIIVGSEQALKTLLQHGANPNQTNATTQFPATITPLILTAQIEQLANRSPVNLAKLLLEQGADPNVGIMVDRKKFVTPLFAAINKRNPEMVDLLIQYGAKLTMVNENGNNALEQAIYDNKHLNKEDKSVQIRYDFQGNIKSMRSPELEKIIELLTNAEAKTNITNE
ncbi:MAG TPA: ankyrin repeat domain-containing protein [Candidatus Babeliales bacterium]|jgi:ankyrin repeat protein|nr:ankyrin repeat domain-containing protein [Candidatus Babeliales bacterium]